MNPPLTFNTDIDHGAVENVVYDGDIIVQGKIDGHSQVYLESLSGNITIEGKIDGGSYVTLNAAENVTIGTVGGDDDKCIGSGTVSVTAGGTITLGSYIHSAYVNLSAHGAITIMREIDYSATVRLLADGDVTINGKISGANLTAGGSRVEVISNRGSIVIAKNVEGGSKVWATAAGDVKIGQTGGANDRKISGDSLVSAMAGGNIDIGGGIGDSYTVVDFVAHDSVSIGNDISGGAHVQILAVNGLWNMGGIIKDSGTQVLWWAPNMTKVNPGWTPKTDGIATAPQGKWTGTGTDVVCVASSQDGSWWENWGQTFGYVVSPSRVVPRTLQELVDAVKGSGNVDRPDTTPVKAVGGGWSFTDAALPFQTPEEVERVSIMDRGRFGQQDLHDVLNGLSNSAAVRMDLLPEAVMRNAAFSTSYDQTIFRNVTQSGAQLPAAPSPVRLIDTRALASSLQCEFPCIRAQPASQRGCNWFRRSRGDVAGSPSGMVVSADQPRQSPEILFHVEAGITMADLQQLLDHQFPRLALRASGGSPGATLAGTLSTATHGGEFAWPLLVDTVRAIHLVGPGGEQWWIEGDVPVADKKNLKKRYKNLNDGHIIMAGWKGPNGLTAQDMLNAVTVSMGTMGVIYSVVLAVHLQFGLHQVVHPTTWQELLSNAQVSTDDLHKGDASANLRLLNALMDGTINGTQIPLAKNCYVDLAINPINRELNNPNNRDCWILNREETQTLPIDPNPSSTALSSLGDYITALRLTMARQDDFDGDKLIGRILNFFQWGTDWLNVADHLIKYGGPLPSFVMDLSDPLVGIVATATVQAIANNPNHPEHGTQFVSDLLSGFFHALEGTLPGALGIMHSGAHKAGRDAESTGISYQIGAIGWPNTGVPGRGLEIALDPSYAFTFLQKEVFDGVFDGRFSNTPFFGYISVRVCPQTKTMLGMQQYAPYSVMIEVVSYRSPEANEVMDEIQQRALAFNGQGPQPRCILHWGLENTWENAKHLAASPLGQTYKFGLTRLDAFRAVRKYIQGKNVQVFDNYFSKRMGL